MKLVFCTNCHQRVRLPKGFENIYAGSVNINCPNCQKLVKIKGKPIPKTDSTSEAPLIEEVSNDGLIGSDQTNS